MQFMRSGATMEDVARIGLGMPGLALSNDGLPTSQAFAQALLVRTKGAAAVTLYDVLTMVAALDAGQTTRPKLLSEAAATPGLAVATEGMVETSLLYLAGAGREASRRELDQAAGSTTGGASSPHWRRRSRWPPAGGQQRKTSLSASIPPVALLRGFTRRHQGGINLHVANVHKDS